MTLDASPAGSVALFGGTFDPPHRGHVAIARAAAERFGLAQVLFAPAGRQPLKPTAPAASFADRLAMTGLACQEDPRFQPSAVEAPDPGGNSNFTVDTLARLATQARGRRLFNLLGADSFHTLARWREPARLLELAEWIVVSRPRSELADPAGMVLTPAQRRRVHLLDDVLEDVSATELRERLHAGEDCSRLLPAGVAAYIAAHGLYR